MSEGKFSQPRPDREEERQIEKAFRQLTGQETPEEPFSQIPTAPETDATMVLPEIPKTPAAPVTAPDDFDIVFDEEALAEDLQLPVEPEAPRAAAKKPLSWLDQLLGFQLPQLLGEHLGRGADHLLQLGKAKLAAGQVPENQGLVFAANEIQGGFHGAVVHKFHKLPPWYPKG